jgi:hypothetical protein
MLVLLRKTRASPEHPPEEADDVREIGGNLPRTWWPYQDDRLTPTSCTPAALEKSSCSSKILRSSTA